jgi:serine/threonine protein kinase
MVMVQLKHFGKYEILRKLGRSMTDVYLAHDPDMNVHVVLKLIEDSRDPFTQTIVEAERRGAQIQKQLHHLDARILDIYDFGEQNGCFFVAMEHCEGRTIAEIIRLERRLDPKHACRYAVEVLSQLERLHAFVSDIDGRQRAVVHGDIKPSNIQIGADGQVRLLDFGIAKVITYTHNLTRHNLGSPTYCSPERLSKAQVDPHADLWALGVSLYEMISGSLPYQAQSTRRLENLIQSRRPPRALPADCPDRLCVILSKALAADIKRRYSSAPEFENDLRAFLEDRPTVAEHEKLPSWDSNETLQKSLVTTSRVRFSLAQPVARAGQWLQRNKGPLAPWLAACVGFLTLPLLVIPIRYAYDVYSGSRSLPTSAEYSRRTAASIEADWNLYGKTQRQYSFLGGLSPARSLASELRQNLLAAADAVIDSYRNSSDPSLSHFDWSKARLCLLYALQIDSSDTAAHGKLALSEGYLNLLRDPQLPNAARTEASFQIAASDLPVSPDAHLALARLYTYVFKNVGKAMGAFSEAERRSFRCGPRELEQQADGYRFRAEYELRQASREAPRANSAADWLRRTRDDLERARNLYEPMAGFSNVDAGLAELYRDRDSEALLRAQLAETARKAAAAKRPVRRRQTRSSAVWR